MTIGTSATSNDNATVSSPSSLHMLTTTDNPYNPFTQWDEWFAFDTQAGYHTSSFLARVVRTSDELSEVDQDRAIEDAIDEIVKENTLGIYRKVTATFS